MAQDFHIDASDLRRLDNMLQSIAADNAGKMGKRVTSKSLAKAGRVIARESQKNLRSRNKQRTGNLISSIKVKVKKRNDGVLAGFEHPKGNHAHLVDLGHELVVGPKRVKTGKRTKPSLFHSDAREKLPQAAAMFVKTYESEIVKIAPNWAT